ncbi:neuroplastin [Agrilus planipennis]|uniref:Neuroplastin n=1 Tax=Agrilus planipennis TaxID=224129 RepID=A0A1W4WZJ0_AGRPL|nr:neuroplastin [Agrilus planipennis]
MKYLVSYTTLLYIIISVNYASSYVNITGVYDEPTTSTKKYDIKHSLQLACNVTTDIKDITVRWEKEGKLISAIEALKNRIKISGVNGLYNLTIKGAEENDGGNYSCIAFSGGVELARANITAASRIYIRTPRNINVVEGEKLRIHCQVHGNPLPDISWFVERHLPDGTTQNETYYSSRDRVTLEEDDRHIVNSVFIINEVTMEDRGNYSCRGYLNITEAHDESYTMVRVKDKYAALWPFLGICAEVFVLCAIILIYEKKRNKTELEESDTDQSPDQKNTPDHGGKDSNLRHRQ